MDKKNRQKKNGTVTTIISAVMLLAGLCIFLYPTISNLRNTQNNEQLIVEYDKTAEELEKEEFREIWENARSYNEQHRVNVIEDTFKEQETEIQMLMDEKNQTEAFDYEELLNPAGNNIMGYLEIPKIDVRLAIYHGTGTEALENGCGHIEGTSLPTGGLGNHAAFSAHRGLPSARLFSDLDQMEIGDLFSLQILDETLIYEVDQILTVLPNELEALMIEEDKDLVTLVTCTPYGVNSHRLLVRGERTDDVQDLETGEQKYFLGPEESAEGFLEQIKEWWIGIILAAVLILVGIVYCVRKKK